MLVSWEKWIRQWGASKHTVATLPHIEIWNVQESTHYRDVSTPYPKLDSRPATLLSGFIFS